MAIDDKCYSSATGYEEKPLAFPGFVPVMNDGGVAYPADHFVAALAGNWSTVVNMSQAGTICFPTAAGVGDITWDVANDPMDEPANKLAITYSGIQLPATGGTGPGDPDTGYITSTIKRDECLFYPVRGYEGKPIVLGAGPYTNLAAHDGVPIRGYEEKVMPAIPNYERVSQIVVTWTTSVQWRPFRSDSRLTLNGPFTSDIDTSVGDNTGVSYQGTLLLEIEPNVITATVTQTAPQVDVLTATVNDNSFGRFKDFHILVEDLKNTNPNGSQLDQVATVAT